MKRDLHNQLASLYRDLADVHAKLAREAGDEYVDQNASPLGSRLHCRLVRTGELAGFKAGRKVLARASDIDGWLAKHRIYPTAPKGDDEAMYSALAARIGL
jgi:hypothetical protein